MALTGIGMRCYGVCGMHARCACFQIGAHSQCVHAMHNKLMTARSLHDDDDDDDDRCVAERGDQQDGMRFTCEL